MIWSYLVGGPWIVFAVYWFASALKTRRTVSQESLVSRYRVLFLEILGFVLLFSKAGNIGVLRYRILPQTYTLAVIGVVLTWIGIALAIWARWHLGQYWSVRVSLKEDHKLIRTGPYAYFRHPIYSGIDLAAIGGALAIDRWRGIVGVALIVLGYWIKAKKEESMLSAQFGEPFQEHCHNTGFLFPKF